MWLQRPPPLQTLVDVSWDTQFQSRVKVPAVPVWRCVLPRHEAFPGSRIQEQVCVLSPGFSDSSPEALAGMVTATVTHVPAQVNHYMVRVLRINSPGPAGWGPVGMVGSHFATLG